MAVETGQTAAVKELLQSLSVPLNEDEVARMGLPLHSAIRNRHEDIFRVLVDRGLDISIRDEAGNTPLHIAAEFNVPRVVDILLESGGCEADIENEANSTPLHLASKEGHSRIVQTLLEFCADKDTRDAENLTPIWLASYYGHVKVVEDLVALPLPDVKSINHLGWTALHAAYDNPRITKLLLGAKAEPDAKDHKGCTPLALAATGGQAETIRVLLAAGAATDIPDMDGNLTVHLASQSHSRMAVEVLAQSGVDIQAERNDGTTALHLACEGGKEATVEYLLHLGLNARKESDHYGTPLTAAMLAAHDCVAIGELLVKSGANVNDTGGEFQTPLQAACAEGLEEAVEWLLGLRADVNCIGGKYGTALCAAVASDKGDSHRKAQLLLDRQADVDASGDRGTPLQIAASKGSDTLIDLLLQRGADPTVVAGELSVHPALNAAIKNTCRLGTIQALLSKGANPRASRHRKNTPLQIATRRGRADVFQALVEAGADPMAEDVDSQSLLMYALRRHSDGIVDYLLREAFFVVAEKDVAGRTPLIVAVDQGGGNVKKLLSSGFDVTIDAQDSIGGTALMNATFRDHLATVKTLLAAGADPTIEDYRGRGALYWASRVGRYETFEAILGALVGRACFREHCEAAIRGAVMSNKLQILEKLLEDEESDLDRPGTDTWTPLYIARMYNLDRVRKMLLKGGAGFLRFPLKMPSDWHSGDKSHYLLIGPETGQLTMRGTRIHS
jgi:ankyrin